MLHGDIYVTYCICNEANGRKLITARLTIGKEGSLLAANSSSPGQISLAIFFWHNWSEEHKFLGGTNFGVTGLTPARHNESDRFLYIG